MEIINILEINNGIPQQIVSFKITNKKLRQKTVDKAEKLFIDFIKTNSEFHTPEDITDALENGVYSDSSGYEVYIIWSNIEF